MVLNDKERAVIESLSDQIRSTAAQNDNATRRARGAIIQLAHPASVVDFARDVAGILSERGIACPALVAFVERPGFTHPHVDPVLGELATLVRDNQP